MKQKTAIVSQVLPLDLNKNISFIGPNTLFSSEIVDKILCNDLINNPDQDVIFLNYPTEKLISSNVLYLDHESAGQAIEYYYEILMKCLKDKTNLPQLVHLVIYDLEKLVLQLKYAYNVDDKFSLAYKLKKVMAQGSSIGIHSIVISQRYTADSFPSSLKIDFSQSVVLKLNNPSELAVMNVFNEAVPTTDREVSFQGKVYSLDEKSLSIEKDTKKIKVNGLSLSSKINDFIPVMDAQDLLAVRKIQTLTHRPYTSVAEILKKILGNFGAERISNPKYQLSESLLNFSYQGKDYSLFVYNKDTAGQDTKNLVAFSQLENTSDVLVISLSDENFFKSSPLQSYPVLFVKDLEQLVKYKIDESLLKQASTKLLREIQATLPFFKVDQK